LAFAASGHELGQPRGARSASLHSGQSQTVFLRALRSFVSIE
jgi:hypothetical protein